MNMPKITYTIVLLFAIVFSLSAQQKLLVCGSGWNRVAIVDKNTAEIEWSYEVPEGSECNSVQQTGDGNILFSYKKGARLITKSKEIVWDFKVEKGDEVQSVTQLPDGNYFLAVCAQPSRFITLNAKGELISEQNYDLNVSKNHAQFRQVTPTTDETLIIPVLGKSKVIEIDKNSNLLREIEIKGNLFSVKVLPNKKWLVSCGDAHQFVIVDQKKGKIVKSYTDDVVKGCSLNFVAEIQFLPNNNFLIANWNGHAKDKTQPKIVEVDKKGKVVWTLPHNDEIRNVSSVALVKE